MMDFSLGKMPWEGTQDNLQKMKDVKSWAGKAGKRWVGNKSEEFEMQWVPFRYKDVLPMLPKDDPIEDYDNDISKFIMPEREGLKAEKQLIQSLANMRFYELNDEEDEFEDELEFANFEPEPEPITPIKQIIKPRPRKFTPPLVSDNDDLILTSVREVVKKRKKTDNVPDGRVSKRPAKPPQEDDRFSAANMLRNFMAVRRGSVLPELESSIKDPSSSSSLPNIPQKPSQQPTPPTITPAPRLNPHPPRASFIVSTALLSQRSLFRRIKAVYPNATFIERDYTDPFTTASDDAELIISPKVGLIYTSLQALQQRPLPGETAAFASGATIKTRVQQLCLKYERLVIIVWNRNSIVPTPSDTAVLDDFGKFTAALGRECSLTVQHVQGPEESVAAWTACAMMNLGSWWELVEEESAWEGRLRAVGLNAFAAQAVMGMFGEDVAAFFKLGTREMMERAGGVVGERVIRRVMANLDKSLVGSERR
ncbi:hypothetical protein EDC01DRAFT_641720 [Geopyxis carbonaria]|nr:hypothetical protein EDC01DRAFT_641720 [Geopyxis carbonaria]